MLPHCLTAYLFPGIHVDDVALSLVPGSGAWFWNIHVLLGEPESLALYWCHQGIFLLKRELFV